MIQGLTFSVLGYFGSGGGGKQPVTRTDISYTIPVTPNLKLQD